MTRHVLDRLPLWIVGDLEDTEMAAVDRHLAQCPGCRAEAERLSCSQGWLREVMASPFGAPDGDRLRRQVMAQIRAEAGAKPTHRLCPRSAVLLAACAASLLLGIFLWRQGPVVPVPLPACVPKLPRPPLQPMPSTTARRQDPRSPHPRRPATISGEDPPQVGPARIEFQTADPTIRIIWLAQATPLPDATPPIQEAP
jgi:hypothetical protein